MLKVSIVVHPFGEDSNLQTISSIFIANMGVKKTTNNKTLYYYWINRDPREKVSSLSDPLRLVSPKQHGKVWHLRENGANELLRLILNQAKRKCLY